MRLALRLLQLGAVAIVLAATAHRGFDLDRFLVPKELVLHGAALLAGLCALRRPAIARLDSFLLAYLGLSIVSAVLATNPWLAIRSVAITASAFVLFRVARALRESGLAGDLLGALAFGVVLAAVTALLQAYGVRLDVFSINRAPGGTIGNRNFVAHALAFGFPVVLLCALRARSAARSVITASGVTLVTAALVLTRSRAAWLAFGAMAIVFFLSLVLAPQLRRDGVTWRRLVLALLFAGIGVAAALLLPNTLRWRSDNPYLESLQGVANYEEGSGRGRLLQYERSLRMSATSPLFGVGAGNWSVAYPAHVPANDPSLDTSEAGMTFNPWPSSDWVAFLSERGWPAGLLMIGIVASLALGALRQLRRALDVEEATGAAALLATLVAAGVAGTFDAVLLLALPAFFVWTSAGALYGGQATLPVAVDEQTGGERRQAGLPVLHVLLVLMAAVGAVRSASQLVAMEMYVAHGDRASLQRAARIDPGSYKLHLRLARGGKGRCEHALAARALYPNAEAARRLARGCR